MADKLSIFKGAALKVGESVVTDVDDTGRPIVLALNNLWDGGAFDVCLEIVKPRFAAVLSAIDGAVDGFSADGHYSYDYLITLPTNYLTTLGLYSDPDFTQKINRYVHTADGIYVDYPKVYLHYISRLAGLSLADPTSPLFDEVLTCYLAREVCHQFDPDRYDALNQQLQAAIELATAAESARESLGRPSVEGSPLSDAWLDIYNDALMILGKEKLAAGDSDSLERSTLDSSVAAGVVGTTLENTQWRFGTTSDRIEYSTSAEPEWGYAFAFDKPDGMHRMTGLFTDEAMRNPLIDFADEGDYWFAGVETIYVRYVATAWLTTPAAWPDYFRRLVAANIARDAAPVLSPANIDTAEIKFRDRRDAARNVDAMQSPPMVVRSGSWLRSRYGDNYGRGRP